MAIDNMGYPSPPPSRRTSLQTQTGSPFTRSPRNRMFKPEPTTPPSPPTPDMPAITLTRPSFPGHFNPAMTDIPFNAHNVPRRYWTRSDDQEPKEKRRRVVKSNPSPSKLGSSPTHSHGRRDSISSSGGAPPSGSNGVNASPSTSRRPPALAPIKPIGFAAAREARGGPGALVGATAPPGSAGGLAVPGPDGPIPSPVVMGFDFKSIDEEQLKTVRDTISIKEQQQALIAARRKQAAASQPSTPRELTFKDWRPKDTGDRRGGVGVRREKTKDKVERMTIVTSATDKDVVPGSKSAPLNQGLSSQQTSPHDPPSGSQTSIPHNLGPSNMFPQMPHTAHPHTRVHVMPPLPHPHGSGASFFEHHRGSSSVSEVRRPSHNGTHASGPEEFYAPSVRSSVQPVFDKRNFSIPASMRYPPASPQHEREREASSRLPPGSVSGPGERSMTAGEHPSTDPHSDPDDSTSPPHPRREFLAPFNQLYDMVASAEQLRFTLQDLIRRVESTHASQVTATREFKQTTQQAGVLLGNLQASAESLKEMVRYEVGRVGGAEKKEAEEMKERMKVLEKRIEELEKERAKAKEE